MSEDLHAPPAQPPEATNFFGPGSPYLHHPLLTAERSAAEVAAIVAHCDLTPGARIADVGCGFGRHTVELARRHFEVVALDPSATMLNETRDRLEAAGLTAEVHTGDGRNLSAHRPFDAILALFTTLGQVGSGADDLGLIASLTSSLTPQGRLIIEVPQRDATVSRLIGEETFVADGVRTAITRLFDPATKIVQERFVVEHPDRIERFRLAYRLYDHDEVAAALTAAGLDRIQWSPSLTTLGSNGERLGPDDPTMVVVASAS